MAAGVASYAVARARIGWYLSTANKDYFHPRGLHARVVRGDILNDICKLPDTTPILAAIEQDEMDSQASAVGSSHPLRDQRLAALKGYIAPLQFDGLPPRAKEGNALDMLSAKLTARSHAKSEAKAARRAVKKHGKLGKAEGRRDARIDKINAKAARRLAKHPENKAKIERKQEKKLARVDSKIEKRQSKAGVGTPQQDTKVGAKMDKKGSKMLFIVVQNLDEAEKVMAKAVEDRRMNADQST